MVQKFAVLLRIQHFQQRRGRVALVGSTHLVYFIQHDHRVGNIHVLECLDQFARHGTNVSASMALDLRLVPHTAQAEAVKLAPQGIGDRATDTGLTDPGWTHQQQYRAVDTALEVAHCKKFNNSLFDVLKPVMVVVKLLPGVGQIKIVIGKDTPGDGTDPVEIVPGDPVLGGS